MTAKILTLLVSLTVALSTWAQSDRDYIRRGNRLMRDSIYDKAQVEYQKAIEANNTNAVAHYNLGNALLYQNKTEDALKEYDAASRYERDKLKLGQIYHNMGVLLQASQQFDKAVACYKNSLRNNPSSDETRYNYALCLYQLKNNSSSSDNQDQEKDENGEGEKNEQEKDEQQQQQQQQQDSQQQEAQPDPNQMSKENAEQLLNAAMQDEKDTQEKLQQAIKQGERKRLRKQW